eukprot:snap_masked-scaffold_22-processed-gene-0.27-mRNA-1 protein AED:1.00 eAED:1.00 QI:0/0/0/0/1/1/3/0/79
MKNSTTLIFQYNYTTLSLYHDRYFIIPRHHFKYSNSQNTNLNFQINFYKDQGVMTSVTIFPQKMFPSIFFYFGKIENRY